MSFIDKLMRRKYFRYDLFVNTDGVWKKYGDYKEFLDYRDIENPDPGSVIKLYGVYKDLSRKEGWARKSLWEHTVPLPGGVVKGLNGKAGKSSSIEEKLMEKIVENADFSGLKPSKMSLPFGKSGGSLEFATPSGGVSSSSGGYVKMGDNFYPMGELPPLEFEGALPSWMHPAASGMIMGVLDKLGGIVKSAIGGAITETTGIKARNDTGSSGNATSEFDAVSELDTVLEEGSTVGKEEPAKEAKSVVHADVPMTNRGVIDSKKGSGGIGAVKRKKGKMRIFDKGKSVRDDLRVKKGGGDSISEYVESIEAEKEKDGKDESSDVGKEIVDDEKVIESED